MADHVAGQSVGTRRGMGLYEAGRGLCTRVQSEVSHLSDEGLAIVTGIYLLENSMENAVRFDVSSSNDVYSKISTARFME